MKNIYSFLKHLILLSLVGFFLNGFSQSPVKKFGKVDVSDLAMTKYDPDTSASAVVLFDKGETTVSYSQESGFKLIFDRHVRVKILKKSGYDNANFKINLYQTIDNSEKITGLKGRTYNLVDGKIDEDKLSDNAVFTENRDKNHKIISFTLPNIREGSVFEVKYEITSDFLFNLQDWDFQYSIPAIWSEYETTTPEYFAFFQYAKGYIPFFINEKKNRPATITLTFKDRSEGTVTKTDFYKEDIKFINNYSHWACKDVPAFIEEPYMTTSENYITKIEFELASLEFPQQPIRNFTTTWDKITEDLLTDNDFGDQLKKGNLVKEEVKLINATVQVPEEKMKMAYDYVKNAVKWNNKYSIYTSNNLRTVLKEKTGNVAEVNLLLTLLLKELGFNADPVVLSTRDNGILHPSHPSLTKLNYLVCQVDYNGNKYLLDATEPMLPFNMLPFRCMNGQGRLINNNNPQWVDLLRNERYISMENAQVTLSGNGEISCNLTNAGSGYTALNVKNSFKKDGKEEFTKKRKEKLKGWEIDEVSFESVDSVNSSYKEKYVMRNQEIATTGSNMIYFNVLLNMGDKDNPFKLEKREYPVDFGCPMKDTYLFTYQIPDGYVVESLPQNALVSLPDNAANFNFNVTSEENKIIVTSQFSINQFLFVPDDYPNLKEFFNRVISKYAEQIVLKKKV